MVFIFKTLAILAVGLFIVFLVLMTAFHSQFFAPINQNFRNQISKNPLLKSIFYLNETGDAKSVLLTSESLKIVVVENRDFRLLPGTEDYLRSELKPIVNATEIKVEKLEENEAYDFDGPTLERLSKRIIAGENVIVIFLLSEYEYEPTRVGLSISDRAILLFKGRINRLSETEFIRQDLERSTILHEIGHLIGLGHNDVEGCLMNVLVESPGNDSSISLPTRFCDLELSQIEKIKKEAI